MRPWAERVTVGTPGGGGGGSRANGWCSLYNQSGCAETRGAGQVCVAVVRAPRVCSACSAHHPQRTCASAAPDARGPDTPRRERRTDHRAQQRRRRRHGRERAASGERRSRHSCRERRQPRAQPAHARVHARGHTAPQPSPPSRRAANDTRCTRPTAHLPAACPGALRLSAAASRSPTRAHSMIPMHPRPCSPARGAAGNGGCRQRCRAGPHCEVAWRGYWCAMRTPLAGAARTAAASWRIEGVCDAHPPCGRRAHGRGIVAYRGACQLRK